MYVCPQACKDGWKVGCRRIIGLVGCFLKGYFQGYLLTTVGIDANDCIYPIAYAVVESENMSSWHWFVEILQTDLEIDNSFNICFMSDRQKEVIEDIFPYAKDRKCVRHMYTNFNEKHKDQALKDVVWKAARATYLREFKNAMDLDQRKCVRHMFWPTYAGVNTYHQVEAGLSYQHVVDLDQRSCPNQWDLVTNMEPILPPIIRRPPGRPTKKRRLEPDELTNLS
ncbi:hypothetical protein V6N13_009278 [Hibiscus sabdariffa]